MILIPYIISFSLGYLLLLLLLDHKLNCSFLKAPLALGVGLGISSILTFLTIVLANGFYPWLIISLHIFLLAFLVWGSYQRISSNFKRTTSQKWDSSDLCTWIVILSVVPAGYVLYRFALTVHPYGEWDAWAVWNMKTQFLVHGKTSWSNIFKLHWHTQPDYPLLLPSLNAWISAFSLKHQHFIPLLNSVIYTMLNTTLIFGAIKQILNAKWGLLVYILIITNPLFVFIGTSQYADILFAFYLLAGMILLSYGLNNSKVSVIGLGLGIVGLSAFVKNEGFFIALITLALTLLIIVKHNLPCSKKILGFSWILGILPGAAFKIIYAPANRDINLQNLMSFQQLFSIDRTVDILTNFGSSLWNPQWRWINILLFLLIIFNLRYAKQPRNLIMISFILCYFASLFVIYMTTANFDLNWRLSRTCTRILFYLFPLFIFTAFSLFSGRLKENNS